MDVRNILVDGLHMDNEPAFQPPNTYRDALNGNLVSAGANSYSYEFVKGTIVSFTLPVHAPTVKPFTPIGYGSFTTELIVLSANDDTIKAGEIGKVTFDNQGTGTYTPLYYHDRLGFTKDFPFSPKDGIVCNDENSVIKRIYFTDNHNPFRVLNVADPRLTTYIASGDLEVGKYYMILTNGANVTIVHNATTYGPGHANTNVFLAVNANYTGSAYVIEYIPVETLDVVPQHNLGNIQLKQLAYDGSLYSGSYQYFYQLESADGARTNFSYVTRPVYIGGTNVPGDTLLSYQNVGGNIKTTDSKKRVILRISGIDTNFSKIRVGYVRATDLGVYEDPEIFYIGSTGSANAANDYTLEINHYGNEVGEALQNADLTSINAVLDLVKGITSTKKYLFPANVGLANDIDFDMSPTVSCETFEYMIPGDLAGEVTASNLIVDGYGITGQARCGEIDTGNTSAKPGQWYEVYSAGGAGTCTYNATLYAAGEYFKGVAGVTAITQTGDGKAIAVIRIQKYTSPSTLLPGNYENTRILGDYADYKGAVVSHKLVGHWRQEKYRFGLMLWSKQGFPFFVRYLADKEIPSQYATTDPDTGNVLSYNPRLVDYNATTKHTQIRVMGIRFSNLDFQLIADALGCALADIDQYLKGFSIVRCPRDEQIIAQGMLYPTVIDATSTITIQMATNDLGNNLGARRYNYYNWFSPDFILQYDGRPNVASGDYMRLVDYYDPTNNGAPSAADGLLAVSGNDQFYWKHYNQIADPAPGNPLYGKGALQYLIPDKCVAIEMAATGVVPSGGGITFDNKGVNGVFAGLASGLNGVGGRTMLVALNVDETAYPNGFGNHGAFVKAKPIVNWVRPKSAANLYGGTSDAAKAANQYMWIGHFQAFDSNFMTYMTGTADATPSNPAQTKTAGIVNNVEVFGGDCFINHYDAIRTIKDVSAANQVAYATVFPCESNINIAYRTEGIRHFANHRFWHATEAPDGIAYDSTILPASYSNETYNYEEYYSNTQSQMYYPAKPLNFNTQTRNEHLILSSDPKTDGESLDSWRNFRANNFKIVDGRYGAINNVRAKASRLFYWQNRGIGYLPVQERTTIGSALGDVVQLGVGGVLDRYDELDYHFGNQHQFSLMESDEYFAWFDLRRKTVLRMSFGGGLDKVTMINGIESYINAAFEEIETEASPNIFDSDNPITGMGICSVYDSNFKLGLMTFKFSKTILGRVYERDFTVGFSKDLNKYVGFFSFTPGIYTEHNGHLLSCKILRATLQANTSYAVGDELYDPNDGGNYVCYLAYTSGGAPTSPATTLTNWVKTSQITQTHVHWRGHYGKFYGIAYPWHIQVVVKGPGLEVITVDNCETKGNDTPFTDVYVQNSYQSGSDLNIKSTNRNYKYVDASWWYNLPLASTGARLVDTYEMIKLRLKNYDTNPTISTNLAKRIFSIRSSIRKKL